MSNARFSSTPLEQILQENAPLVRSIALKMMARLPANIELDDLIQAGMIGLMDAARRFENTGAAQFTSYATTRIKGAIMDELRRQDWLPRTLRSKKSKIQKAIAQAEKKLGHEPDDEAIAEELGVDVEEYREQLSEAGTVHVVHYEDFRFGKDEDDGDSHSLDRLTGGSDSFDPQAALLNVEFRQTLVECITRLPEKEKLILSLIFEQALNLKEIGAVLDLTEGRVSQLRSQAVLRLRGMLKEAYWDKLPENF